MRLIIDRFEGDYVVCEMESKQTMNIERSKIPIEAKEGDILEIKSGIISINSLETEKRRSEIGRLASELWT